jgi:uncharacterized protein
VRIVCDTNVLVSGILFEGDSREILLLASRDRVTNFISDAIRHEVKDVLLRPTFGISPQQAIVIIALFRDTFELVYPAIQNNVVQSDPGNNCILDAAMEARADIIVSGDMRLRSLEQWQGIRILSPKEFVQKIVGSEHYV